MQIAVVGVIFWRKEAAERNMSFGLTRNAKKGGSRES